MGGISENKLGGIALILGPVLAVVFFLLQPTGLLIDRVEVGNPEEAIRTYAANAGMTKLTSIAIAISLVTTIYGLSVACARIRDGGDLRCAGAIWPSALAGRHDRVGFGAGSSYNASRRPAVR